LGEGRNNVVRAAIRGPAKARNIPKHCHEKKQGLLAKISACCVAEQLSAARTADQEKFALEAPGAMSHYSVKPAKTAASEGIYSPIRVKKARQKHSW